MCDEVRCTHHQSVVESFFLNEEEKKMKMEKYSSLLFICFLCVIVFCNGIETPQFTVIHTESDFEVRLYRESSWMSAPVREMSFEKATKLGFHRLYQYIRGANLNSSELMMTAPVLTSINPKTRESEYIVRYYVPMEFHGVAPRPSTDLNLQFVKWISHCVAVRKFSGFAADNNLNKEVESLVNSLGKLQLGDSVALNKHQYSIAQYNASTHTVGRLNEVWMDVGSAFIKEGCRSNH
ncbi:hypothetical protein C5167_042263 [Papaver somniferum]|uniref:SOUL heme-binding protein n=1 Tax=Papaver somniferum TaxID=3469 RepID=A0A4Y7L408_PAPSO|nr:heme-binding protein 2-like isoform X2 [Papaver somniferum]RZC79687.1 hypothetical protein C5167_042263 [Papaver somniferum]